MTMRRAAQSQGEPVPLFRPMSEFDPSEPALVHDLRQDRLLPWSPSFQRSYKRTARELTPGVVDYDGLLLDGWMIPEDECQH